MTDMRRPDYWAHAQAPQRELQEAMQADHVDVVVDQTGKLWMNIDGRCAIRIGHVSRLIFEDSRGRFRVWPGRVELET
ncbi:hypothetical protein EHM76_04395 [bacterium]|nr:MAG: hypothetical protein EHM76_04395 [bacterium]